MSFRNLVVFLFSGLLVSLMTACSDSEREDKLVDLFTTASLDIVAISFPADSTEEIVSINSFSDYTVQGLKSNGVDTVAINDNIVWSLSQGAVSTIDQNGRLSAGSTAENITITATVGQLSASQPVRVSDAKFDQVVMLNSTAVTINMCQAQQITPIGRYVNDDGSEEIREVDSSIIDTITWIISNEEGGTPSQRAIIKTENSQAFLQAFEIGNVVIRARAMSVSSGEIVTSEDFNQTIDNNLNSLKLCLKSDSDLAACSLSDTDVVEDNVVSLQAVGNYQASDGSSFNQNISAYSKWGIDDSTIATIAFSSDRQQVDVTGVTPDATAKVSVACGNIQQNVTNDALQNGVILDETVTCGNGFLGCVVTSVNMPVVENTVSSLSVTANGTSLVDGTALVLDTRPDTIVLNVTASFADGSEENVTDDADTNYDNQTVLIITGVSSVSGEYTVLNPGDAEIQITNGAADFTARITIP